MSFSLLAEGFWSAPNSTCWGAVCIRNPQLAKMQLDRASERRKKNASMICYNLNQWIETFIQCCCNLLIKEVKYSYVPDWTKGRENIIEPMPAESLVGCSIDWMNLAQANELVCPSHSSLPCLFQIWTLQRWFYILKYALDSKFTHIQFLGEVFNNLDEGERNIPDKRFQTDTLFLYVD